MKECWFCGRKLMKEAPELGKDWFKCECGATWIDITRMGEGKATYMGTPWGGPYAISKAEARRQGIFT